MYLSFQISENLYDLNHATDLDKKLLWRATLNIFALR